MLLHTNAATQVDTATRCPSSQQPRGAAQRTKSELVVTLRLVVTHSYEMLLQCRARRCSRRRRSAAKHQQVPNAWLNPQQHNAPPTCRPLSFQTGLLSEPCSSLVCGRTLTLRSVDSPRALHCFANLILSSSAGIIGCEGLQPFLLSGTRQPCTRSCSSCQRVAGAGQLQPIF